MRLARTAVGLCGVLGEALVPLQAALDAAAGEAALVLPTDMVALLGDEAAMTACARALAFAARPENGALRHPIAGLLAPLLPG